MTLRKQGTAAARKDPGPGLGIEHLGGPTRVATVCWKNEAHILEIKSQNKSIPVGRDQNRGRVFAVHVWYIVYHQRGPPTCHVAVWFGFPPVFLGMLNVVFSLPTTLSALLRPSVFLACGLVRPDTWQSSFPNHARPGWHSRWGLDCIGRCVLHK